MVRYWSIWIESAQLTTMSDTYVTCTVSPCVHQVDIPILNLDTQAGAEIAGAVLAVWAAAWAFRTLIRLLNSDSVSTTESDL